MIFQVSVGSRRIRGSERKIFNIREGTNNYTVPVCAVGVFLYKQDAIGRIMILHVYHLKKWREDLGGKVDPEDATFVDTAIREVTEETNGAIMMTPDRFINAKYLYHPKGMYLNFIIPATPEEAAMNGESFGYIEKGGCGSGKFRMITWEYIINFDELPVNPRVGANFAKICEILKGESASIMPSASDYGGEI